jgi:DNA-binding IclR family transcriptional regulator
MHLCPLQFDLADRVIERGQAVLEAIAAGHTTRLALQAQLAPLSPSIVNHLLNRLQRWGRIQLTGHCTFGIVQLKKTEVAA